MITKIPLRLARSMVPINYTNFRLNIPQSIIEKNHLYQLVQNGIIFETMNVKPQVSNSDYIDSKGFRVQEFEEQLRIELSKTVGTVQILICIDYQNKEMLKKEQNNNEFQIIQAQSESSNTFPNSKQDCAHFSIYLMKDNGNISCYECSSSMNKIQIDMVSIVDDVTEHKMIPREERGIFEYDGNNFNHQEEIQQAMLNYLQTYGVNSELAHFIENFQVDKEETLYMNWLQNQLIYS